MAKAPRKAHQLYEVQGTNLKRKNKNCPKCGPGVRMANHNTRTMCGKCGYTEYTKK